MTGLLFIVAFALGFSFLCSILEAVLLSITPTYIASLREKGKASATILRKLKTDIDRPLSAILTLNTIAHTVGATVAGAQATIVFGSTYVGVFSAVLTILILVVSEIIPKTIGALYWRILAPFSAYILTGLIYILYPFVFLSRLITRMLSGGKAPITVTKEEVKLLVDLGIEEGIFGSDESNILMNLFRFGSVRVREIMTPRPVLFFLSEQETVGDVFEKVSDSDFSRIPVYGRNQDDFTGYVLKTDILLEASRGNKEKTLAELRREIHFVPGATSMRRLFDELSNRKEHLALIVDEFGGVIGLVTMEDILEHLIGREIMDEADTIKDMQQMARERWKERAMRLGITYSDAE